MSGLSLVPKAREPQKAAEFASDAEVRWCPGCGDYAVLAALKSFLPSLQVPRENVVVVSGIGCSSRMPYYLDTYGLHSIHGRAPAIATGLAVSRPDLMVMVVTGDGDALSIGGNHLIHTLRRNLNLTIVLFNNRIYGLTKGQYSPTSDPGTVTKSTPLGSLDHPFNPLSLALGADATFVGRAVDSDRAGLTAVLDAAVRHRGTSLVEVYQDCPVFNDGAFDVIRKADTAESRVIRLVHGEPLVFGSQGQFAVVRRGFGLAVVPTDSVDPGEVVVHDVTDHELAFALSRLSDQGLDHVVLGVLRQVERPTYDDLVREQVEEGRREGVADLQALLHGNDTWTVRDGGVVAAPSADA